MGSSLQLRCIDCSSRWLLSLHESIECLFSCLVFFLRRLPAGGLDSLDEKQEEENGFIWEVGL